MARLGGKNAACASSSIIAAATTIRDRRIDAGESDDVLDVFSVQNVDRVFG